MTDITKIGARIGFLLSFAYSICMILWRYEMRMVLILILLFALVISFFSAIIGSITTVLFGFILKKYKTTLKIFTAICLFISVLVVLPFNWIYFNWASTTEHWNQTTLDIRNDLFRILVPPSIIYVIASGFVSQYLFNINRENEASPSS